MKSYFNIDGLFNELKINNGNTVKFELTKLEVAGSSVLLPDFFTEVIPAFIDPWTANAYQFGTCTQSGTYPNTTAFDVCTIGGVPNSWNPFVDAFLCNYDATVDTLARGAILDTISGNPYGIESFGFGFDVVNVPVNDVPGGGSTGAYLPGAFFVDIDFEQLFEMEFLVEVKNAGGTTIYNKTHNYFSDPADCGQFIYTSTDLLSATPTDKTQIAFLSGGNIGWVVPVCDAGGIDTSCDPIVTQSICVVPKSVTPPNTLTTEVQECCYESLVLANDSGNDWENDINAFLFKRNFSSETIDLVLEQAGQSDVVLIDDTYGQMFDFGSFADFPNYKGYQIQWAKVLAVSGEGVFRLRADLNLVTGPQSLTSIPFTLKEYSPALANGTFRIQSIQNGYLRHTDFDYSGLNWKDGLRIRGFFGNRQPTYEKENIIFTNRQVKAVKKELINEYTTQTMLIPDCISKAVIEFHALANYCIITDYNYNNHSFEFINREVIFEGVETIDYNSQSRFVSLVYKWRDYLQDFTQTNC